MIWCARGFKAAFEEFRVERHCLFAGILRIPIGDGLFVCKNSRVGKNFGFSKCCLSTGFSNAQVQPKYFEGWIFGISLFKQGIANTCKKFPIQNSHEKLLQTRISAGENYKFLTPWVGIWNSFYGGKTIPHIPILSVRKTFCAKQ